MDDNALERNKRNVVAFYDLMFEVIYRRFIATEQEAARGIQ